MAKKTYPKQVYGYKDGGYIYLFNTIEEVYDKRKEEGSKKPIEVAVYVYQGTKKIVVETAIKEVK